MNYIDIILTIPLVWGFYKGFKRGFIVEVATLFSFIIGIYAGVKFSGFLATYLKNTYSWDSSFLPILSFGILFLGILFIVYILAKLIERFVEAIFLGTVNKLMGGVSGVLKFALIMSVLLFLIEKIEKKVQLIPVKTKQESLLYGPVQAVAPFVLPVLSTVKELAIGNKTE